MWKAAFYCDAEGCGKSLTYEQVYQSHGVCPYCGASAGGEMVGHRVESEEEPLKLSWACALAPDLPEPARQRHHDECGGTWAEETWPPGGQFGVCECKCHNHKPGALIRVPTPMIMHSVITHSSDAKTVAVPKPPSFWQRIAVRAGLLKVGTPLDDLKPKHPDDD